MQSDDDANDHGEKQSLPVAPKDAAVLIIIDLDHRSPRVLMGLRNANLVFMPEKFVFPGGRVDPEDYMVPPSSSLSKRDTELLLRKTENFTTPEAIQALPLTAIRETFEETGVLVGRQGGSSLTGSLSIWDDYFAHGVSPALSQLKFCARAITPARNVRRYDTRFFCVRSDQIAKTVEFKAGELEEIRWLTFDEALESELPRITKVILDHIQSGLSNQTLFENNFPVPFYYSENGKAKLEYFE